MWTLQRNDISRWNRNQVYLETYIQKSISTSGDNVLSLVNSIFPKKEKSIPQDPNKLVLEILSNKFARIVVDSRSVCIGIK